MTTVPEVPGNDEPHHEAAHALRYIRPDRVWADPADTGDIHKPGGGRRHGFDGWACQHHLPSDQVPGPTTVWQVYR